MKLIEWTIDSALEFIRRHQLEMHKLNHHLALAGGVLNKGESYNDLDIICMGMRNVLTVNNEVILDYFSRNVGDVEVYVDEDGKYQFDGYTIYKITTKEGKKIDLFLYQ